MKLTINNYKEYVKNKDWTLFEALLIDLEELNQLLEDKNEDYRKLYIDFNIDMYLILIKYNYIVSLI